MVHYEHHLLYIEYHHVLMIPLCPSKSASISVTERHVNAYYTVMTNGSK